MVRLEKEVGGNKSILELQLGQWAYWTWSPNGKNRFEYVIAPIENGIMFANRPDRSHPFYPFRIAGTESGQGLSGVGPTESFKVTVFNK